MGFFTEGGKMAQLYRKTSDNPKNLPKSAVAASISALLYGVILSKKVGSMTTIFLTIVRFQMPTT
jgi:hypothetical protein